jgi:hypothetical protein
MDVYGHLLPTAQKQAAETLDLGLIFFAHILALSVPLAGCVLKCHAHFVEPISALAYRTASFGSWRTALFLTTRVFLIELVEKFVGHLIHGSRRS